MILTVNMTFEDVSVVYKFTERKVLLKITFRKNIKVQAFMQIFVEHVAICRSKLTRLTRELFETVVTIVAC